MKKSCFITNSGINQNTGGGIVGYNLLGALLKNTEVKYVFSTHKFANNSINFGGKEATFPVYHAPVLHSIPAYSINPADYNYNADPFSMDYLAYHILPTEPIDIVQTYGCPFGLTVEELKRKGAKVVADVAPHNLEISQEEHLKLAGKYPYPHLTEEMLWGMYSRNLRLSDVVIVHSHSSAKYIQQKARLKDLPTVIPHGINLPETIPAYPEAFIPGYFGALGIDKGLSYLVRAWVQINNPVPKGELYAGGYGTEAFGQSSYCKALGGFENTSDFYKQISIYIQPSVTEGFGITPLEAMAHGRPAIVTTGTGVADLITDGKDGFVIPIRDIEAIQGRIQYFMDNPAEIQRMGAEARKTAEKYTWDKIREKYVSIYNQL